MDVEGMKMRQDDFERIRCNLCDQDDTDKWPVAPLHYVQCKRCGLIYVNPRPKEEALIQLYNKNDSPLVDDRVLAYQIDRSELLLDEVEKYKIPPGKLLEIGSGYGILMGVAQGREWECVGLELDRNRMNFAIEKMGVRVINKVLRNSEFSFPDRYFDAVILADVIEHFRDPKEDLLEINRILKDDGFVLINTPNAESLWVKIYNRNGQNMDTQQHIFLFTRSTLKLMLEKTGFRVVRLRSGQHVRGGMQAHIVKAQSGLGESQ